MMLGAYRVASRQKVFDIRNLAYSSYEEGGAPVLFHCMGRVVRTVDTADMADKVGVAEMADMAGAVGI